MSIVDVDKMIKQKELSEKASDFKEKAQDKKLQKQLDPKAHKIEFGKPTRPNPANNILEKEKLTDLIQRLREDKESEAEIKSGVKNGIFYIASLPIRSDKRKKLKNNLEGSKFLNMYIDNNLYVDYLQDMNQDLKALACYGFHYVNALKDDITPPNLSQ